MKQAIHKSLYDRLIAVQEAFNQPGFRPVLSTASPTPVAGPKRGNNWQGVIKEEETDDGQGGGGGTMKGLRGKQAEQAKAAMRKLARR